MQQLVDYYLAGNTLKETSLKFNLSIYFVKKDLTENKIPLRKKGELRPQGKCSLDLEYFKTINTPEKAYWLGFIIADGSVSKNHMKLTLGLKSSDGYIVESFQKAIKSSHAVSITKVFDKRTQKTYSRTGIQIASKHFVSHLLKLGVHNSKSFTARFPAIDSNFYSHFFRGLFDGDGSICFLKKGARKINQILSEGLFVKIKEILENVLDIRLPLVSLVAQNDNGDKIIKFHLNVIEDQNRFLNWLYKDSNSNIRLERKYKLSLIGVERRKTGPKPKSH